jgi:hypothetical protein
MTFPNEYELRPQTRQNAEEAEQAKKEGKFHSPYRLLKSLAAYN